MSNTASSPSVVSPVSAFGSLSSKMTSKEISELTSKRHDHVLRDIKKLIAQKAITAPNFGVSEYRDDSGKTNPLYSLDFHATMTLITGYNAVLRSKVIARWMELEQNRTARPAHPNTYSPTIDGDPGTYTFFYRGQQLTVIIDADLKPWFRHADIGRILGYSNPTTAVAQRVVAFPSNKVTVEIKGRYLREVILTDADGLAHVIKRTQYQSAAIPFAHWIAAELFPALGLDGKQFLSSHPASKQLAWKHKSGQHNTVSTKNNQVTLEAMLRLINDPTYGDDSQQSRDTCAKIANAAALRSVVGKNCADQMRSISSRIQHCIEA